MLMMVVRARMHPLIQLHWHDPKSYNRLQLRLIVPLQLFTNAIPI